MTCERITGLLILYKFIFVSFINIIKTYGDYIFIIISFYLIHLM